MSVSPGIVVSDEKGRAAPWSGTARLAASIAAQIFTSPSSTAIGDIEREWRQFGCLSLRGRKRTKTIYSQIITPRTPDEAAGLGQRRQIRGVLPSPF
jgi:hypothetical protein